MASKLCDAMIVVVQHEAVSFRCLPSFGSKLLGQLCVGGVRCAATELHWSQGFGRLSQAKCWYTAMRAVRI
jgi:hypothetical protein